MNWLNLDSGSSARPCVYAQRGADRFYISLLPPAGDLISAGLAGHLSSCTSLHWFSCTFPSHTPLLPSSNKLPGSIPCWRNRVSLFPGAALQDLSRKHQECRRGKPGRGGPETPSVAWPSLGTHHEAEGLPAVVLGPSCRKGRKSGAF